MKFCFLSCHDSGMHRNVGHDLWRDDWPRPDLGATLFRRHGPARLVVWPRRRQRFLRMLQLYCDHRLHPRKEVRELPRLRR